MKYKVEYETYNNKDFKNTQFVDSKEEAEQLMIRLKDIKHITKVNIISPANEKGV